MERRNLVLDAMVETGAITKEQAERAKAEPLHLAQASVDASEAPYFVDLVRDQLVQKLGDRDFNREGLRIYTSLDPELQRLATQRWTRRCTRWTRRWTGCTRATKNWAEPYVYPQVALIALNPHTGQVLALVGGRSYGTSQVNHAVAHRPTGSIFKPFVYAAAFQTAVEGTMLPGQNKLFSPVTMLNDAQTTYGEGTPYEYTPRNYKGEYYGDITARFALMRSDNNATISLASMVGFDRVAALARDAGIKSAQGTPSMAIGSYDATPLDMAGAYTVFANGGVHIDPWMLASVRTPTGDVIDDYSPNTHQVLDPRVAFLTTCMMEACCRATGAMAAWRARLLRNRRRRAEHGIHISGGGKNGHEPRRMVCGLYQQFALRGVGGQRRLHRRATGRRARSGADLGGFYEAGSAAAAVLRHERIHAAGWRADCEDRQGKQPAERRDVPGQLRCGFP